ncbi:MAG: hypothetical protein C0408_08005, partial [Odoribacter sp.]|nr:hypothetical protein [Odoribacter sp.]
MNKILEMKKLLLFSIMVVLLFSSRKITAQEVKRLTFDEVIKLAEEQSPNALMAKHRFRSSYWQYRSFQAQFRPSLTLTGTVPNYSNGFDRIYNSTSGEYQYVAKNTITSSSSLSLSQAVGFTGTTISLRSDFLNLYDFEKIKRTYTTTPVSVRINQPIKQYNSLKWQQKIEPVKYDAAKKTFLANIEAVHISAVQNFFSLALAQINKQISEMNYSNADTLFRIA